MTLYMTIKPIYLQPEVKCNSYLVILLAFRI